MTTSKRLADRKVQRFQKNITKRGAVPETVSKKGDNYPVGPILLGFFVFVVVGSSVAYCSMELRSKIWKKQAFPRLYHPVNSVPLNPSFMATYLSG